MTETQRTKSVWEVNADALELLNAARKLAEIAMEQIEHSEHKDHLLSSYGLDFTIDRGCGRTTIEWYNSSESC